MKRFPIYVLDHFIDLSGFEVGSDIPIQILPGFPGYIRLSAFGTDHFDTVRLFADYGKKSFGVSSICYQICVHEINEAGDHLDKIAVQSFEHPFKIAPVLFQDGVLRFQDNVPILRTFDALNGLPDLPVGFEYYQFIN